MPNEDKLIKVGRLNPKIDKLVGKTISNIDISNIKSGRWKKLDEL